VKPAIFHPEADDEFADAVAVTPRAAMVLVIASTRR
jgi:hypothetical protein